MTILQTIIYHPTAAERNFHAQKGKPWKPGKPCDKPPCSIPLTDFIYVLIIVGLAMAFAKLCPGRMILLQVFIRKHYLYLEYTFKIWKSNNKTYKAEKREQRKRLMEI